MMTYQSILVEKQGYSTLITLNRADHFNALSDRMMMEIGEALSVADNDDKTGCIVITGNSKVFAAGADIKSMAGKTYIDAFRENFPYGDGSSANCWRQLMVTRKPVIAAVSGLALGGGCELALACDMVFAAENAGFGQPEINLGTMPGAGASQRLARAVGKATTMDMLLTGRRLSVQEALQHGIVSRIMPVKTLLAETLEIADQIAMASRPVASMIKEAVNSADNLSLKEGLALEKSLFHGTFSLQDCREGMTAFIEKRPAEFKHQ